MVNRPWVSCTAAAGIVLVILALLADLWWGLDNMVPSVLLELGSGALMAAVLFFVVPHFTRRAVEAAMDGMSATGTTRRSQDVGTKVGEKGV
jgi:hypothetical protein